MSTNTFEYEVMPIYKGSRPIKITFLADNFSLFLDILKFLLSIFPSQPGISFYCKIIRFLSFSFEKYILLYIKRINLIYPLRHRERVGAKDLREHVR